MESSSVSAVKRECTDDAEDNNAMKKIKIEGISSLSPDNDAKIAVAEENIRISDPATDVTITSPSTDVKAVATSSNKAVVTSGTKAVITYSNKTTPTTKAVITPGTKTTSSYKTVVTSSSKVASSIKSTAPFSNKAVVPLLGSANTNNSQFIDVHNDQVFSYDNLAQFDKAVVRKIMRTNELKASLNNEIFKVDVVKNDFHSHFFSEAIIKEAVNNPAIYDGLSNTAKALILKSCELLLIEMSAFCVAHAQEKNKVIVETEDLLHFLCHTEQYDFMCAQVYEK